MITITIKQETPLHIISVSNDKTEDKYTVEIHDCDLCGITLQDVVAQVLHDYVKEYYEKNDMKINLWT